MADEGSAGGMASALTRPLFAGLVLLAIYVAVSFLNSTGGYLGTDTGAKVITLEAMVEEDTIRPDVGYWAEEWDPEGRFHPLYQTAQNEEGEWVSVTTLPMLIAAQPLYELGGYRLALLWPMLGAVLAAFACRAVTRQLSGQREGWTAFWVTGLASPIAVYALDLWEHSLGAALMVGSFAMLLRVIRGAAPWWSLGAGFALGVSATMRTESFVAALVFVGAACLALLAQRRIIPMLTTGALAVAGFAGPWFLNSLLEQSVGGNSRAARVGGATEREWWSELAIRSKEALITWFGLPGIGYPGSVILGTVVVGSIGLAALLLRRGERRAAALALVAGATCYVLSLTSGFAFVSGALVAGPVAAAGIILVRRNSGRTFVLGVALVTTVLTWMFQYTGGAGPQWGGRYLLAPTLLLTCLGVVTLAESPALLRHAVYGMAIVVTVWGLAWLQVRSHGVDEFFDDLADRSEDVVISTNGFLVREAGPSYDEHLYLSLGRGTPVAEAAEIVERAGLETFVVLTQSTDAPKTGATLVGTEAVDLLGVELWLHSFRFTDTV